MHHIILVVLLLLSGFPEILSGQTAILNGTTVVWENGSYSEVIRRHTGSHYSHVAIILNNYVYEASKPNVHRYTLNEYAKIIDKERLTFPALKIHYIYPNVPFTTSQLIKMEMYAKSQLGRPFGVRSYLVKRPQATVHCAEYVDNILFRSNRYLGHGCMSTPEIIYNKVVK